MQARWITAIVASAALASGLAAAPAEAKYRIPEEPEVTIGQRAKPQLSPAKRARSVVSVGWSDRSGLDLYAPAGGGIPMG